LDDIDPIWTIEIFLKDKQFIFNFFSNFEVELNIVLSLKINQFEYKKQQNQSQSKETNFSVRPPQMNFILTIHPPQKNPQNVFFSILKSVTSSIFGYFKFRLRSGLHEYGWSIEMTLVGFRERF
jgi:hypothetical protein